MIPEEESTLLGEVQFTDEPYGGYTYRVPSDLESLEPGLRVRVPFGPRRRIGFLVKVYRGKDAERNKNIISAIDETPLFNQELLDLTRWVAGYYLCEWGEVLSAATPRGLKPPSTVRYRLSDAARAEPIMAGESGHGADLWRALSTSPLSLRQIRNRFEGGSKLLDRFKRRGWLETVEVMPRVRIVRKMRRWEWTGLVDYAEAMDCLPANAVRLREAVQAIRDAAGVIDQQLLRKRKLSLSSQMKKLAARGWLLATQVPVDALSSMQQGLDETGPDEVELSDLQRSIVDQIDKAVQLGTFKPFMLHGVTSSGKSLIYLEAVAAALEAGRDVLVMVPEISLTPQIIGRIHRRFGDLAVVAHSALTDSERRYVWQLARSGRVRVVVGPRSSVFVPLRRLGLIVIDEEHDDSYKQFEPTPRYHGRDVALYRASRCGAVVLMGSATPDIGSYYNALTGRYELLELPERHGSVQLPGVVVTKHGVGGERSVFSKLLMKRLTGCLAKGEQAIILVNRRGFSTCIMCPDCGEAARCPNCDITLRYHSVGQKLECHYCGFQQRVIDTCPKCRGRRLRYDGVATQRVERELELQFPHCRIVRMDLDTTRVRGAHQDILSRFANREYDILMGTQMVSKGHDFPQVTVVGILTADFELLQPDFRAMERAFRLMVQASGRTGRSGDGDVVIQALDPTLPMFRWVQQHNYRQLYEAEVEFREHLGYPPFGRLINAVISSNDRQLSTKVAVELKEMIISVSRYAQLIGPAAPPIERIEGRYRRRLLIKLPARLGKDALAVKKCIQTAVGELRRTYNRKKVRIIIDVDPVNV